MSTNNSVKYFGYTTMMHEEFTFMWRIEEFSLHADMGKMISSPVFESKPSGTRWRLHVDVSSRDPANIYVDLENIVESTKPTSKRFLNVKLSIVGLFGKSRSAETTVFLDRSKLHHRLLSIPKKHMMEDLCGLNKLRLLPGGALTLLCEMTIYEEFAGMAFESEEVFERRYKTSRFHRKRECLKWLFRLFSLLALALLLVSLFVYFIYVSSVEVIMVSFPIIFLSTMYYIVPIVLPLD